MTLTVRAACSALVIGISLLAFAPPAAAQEILLTGPLAGALTGPRVRFGRHDASFWAALGGSPVPEQKAAPFAGLGAQATFGMSRLGSRSELRWGPWGQMWTDGIGGRAEGGLLAQWFRGDEDEDRHGALDVRFGGGAGKDAAGDAPHVSLTIAGGPRYFERRGYSVCRPEDAPRLLLGWRFFVSGRRTLEEQARYWVTGGIELELGFVDD